MECQKLFTSESSKDSLKIRHYPNNRTGKFSVELFDDANENIRLLGVLVQYMKNNDIKWVSVPPKIEYEFPPNTEWFQHKKNNNIYCHVVDFEKFYLVNVPLFVNQSNVYVSDGSEEEGWTKVVDKRKQRRDRLKQIKGDVNNVAGDWTSL